MNNKGYCCDKAHGEQQSGNDKGQNTAPSKVSLSIFRGLDAHGGSEGAACDLPECEWFQWLF